MEEQAKAAKVQGTEATKKERTKSEKQFSIKISRLKTLIENKELGEAVIKAEETYPEAKFEELYAIARGAIMQQNLKL